MDFPDTVQRVLGSSFKTLFNLVSVGFCFACGLINIILITQLIYPLVQALAENRQWDTAPQDEFTLSKISYQYTGILYILLIFPFFLLDRIGPLLKLLSYGAVSICTSVLFIMIKGFISLNSDQELVAENLKYTSPNLVTLAGVFSLAFLGQSMIVPISKNNRVQVHNNRDTKIGI
jgi:amino acid permease